MAATTHFSYQRLTHADAGDDEFDAERHVWRSRNWYKLKRVPVKRRFRLKIPRLRRLLRKKIKVARLSFARVIKRLKESQAYFGDLFAGNYMFIQVNPTTMKGFQKSCEGHGLKPLP